MNYEFDLNTRIRKCLFFLFFFFASILLFGYNKDDYLCGKITGGFKDYPSKNAAKLLEYQYSPIYGDQMQILEEEISKCDEKDISKKFHLYYAYYSVSRKECGVFESHYIIDEILDQNLLQSCFHSMHLMRMKSAFLSGENRYNDLVVLLNNLVHNNLELPDNYLYGELANTYYYTEQYEEALAHYLYLVKYGKYKHVAYASMHNNIALAYQHLGDVKNAKKYFNESLALLDQVEKKKTYRFKETFLFFKKVVQNNLYRLNNNKYDKQKLFKNLQEEFKLGEKTINPSLQSILIELGLLAFELDEIDLAQHYVSILDNTIHDELVKIETKLNYQELKLLELVYHQSKSDTLGKAFVKHLNSMKKNYQRKLDIYFKTSNVDQDWSIKKLDEKEVVIKSEQDSNSKLFYSLLILLIIALSVGYAFFYQRKVKRKIKIQNIIIEEALGNSEMLIKEVHHRVKNNLEIVSSIAYLEYHKNENEFDFESFENKIISLSLIHQLLYSSENISKVRLDQYVQELMDNLEKTCLVDSRISLKIIPIDLPLEFAISFGFLLNELVTNTSKHCKPKAGEQIEVQISLSENEDNFEFIYQDNGYSENKSTEPIVPNMGSGLIELLIYKLRGKHKVSWTNGFEMKIQFKELEVL